MVVVTVSDRPASERRGTERLLRDCALVGRITEPGLPPARVRLTKELGPKLARRLLGECRRDR
jgi:hypothetical protein